MIRMNKLEELWNRCINSPSYGILYWPLFYRRRQNYPYRGYEALHKLLNEMDFETVLDVGCGEGVQANIFLQHKKIVTAIDYGESVYFRKNKNQSLHTVIADINEWNTKERFDCIWCSHVLEHQLNVNIFLKKLHTLLNEGGMLAITVPPLKQNIVGGHVSLWTPGLLLYNLIMAGFDCSKACVKCYDYDISIIVKKETIVLPDLQYDAGDIRRLGEFFSREVKVL